MKKQEIRKIVLEDSISNLSELENNFNEREDRIKAGVYLDNNEISSFDSQASRVNFWKEVNEDSNKN